MKFLPILPIISRFPFLKSAGRVFSNVDVKRELEKFPNVVEEAKQIVLAALDGRSLDRDFSTLGLLCESCEERCVECKSVGKYEGCDLCMECFESCGYNLGDLEVKLYTKAKLSVLRYICARSIASQLESWALMRFAVSEASYYGELLRKESDAVVKLVATDFGIRLRGWHVHVADYVRASSRIRSPEWRLVNRRVRDGFVEATRREVERIIVEFLRVRLSERVPAIVEAPEVERKVAARYYEDDLGEVDTECFPPCMKEIVAQLRRGMNVPHSARFAITSFLLNVGMSVEEVVEIFKSAPDFDEEKTRYQVEHIAGERGKGVEYTSPSCDTMRTYQNCVADCGVPHPLVYYKKCKRGWK